MLISVAIFLALLKSFEKGLLQTLETAGNENLGLNRVQFNTSGWMALDNRTTDTIESVLLFNRSFGITTCENMCSSSRLYCLTFTNFL